MAPSQGNTRNTKYGKMELATLEGYGQVSVFERYANGQAVASSSSGSLRKAAASAAPEEANMTLAGLAAVRVPFTQVDWSKPPG